MIERLIQNLETPYKEVLYLQYFHDMNSFQMAKILKKSPMNIRQISTRAKKMLKVQLEKHDITWEGGSAK